MALFLKVSEDSLFFVTTIMVIKDRQQIRMHYGCSVRCIASLEWLSDVLANTAVPHQVWFIMPAADYRR